MNIKRFATPVVALAVATLYGCGGGGGGDPQEAAALSGFAAKGILQSATVTAHAVDANGVVATSPSASTETDSKGEYELKGLVAGQKYVVKVTPNAKTKHLDEVTNQAQALPDDFVLSAVSSLSTGANTVSVTPFSHQVVLAAQKEAGGLSADNVSKAQAVVQELIGFDPVSMPKNDATTPQGKQLKVLLTAVSQMVSDGALGCSSGTHAEKTKCVTEQFAKSTSVTSLKLEGKNGSNALDVSAEFKTAINKTVTRLQPTDPDAALAMTQVLAKLDCQTNCTPVKPVDGDTRTAVAKVKEVLAEIRTDLTTVFSGDGVSKDAKGKLNAELFKFKTTTSDAQLEILGQTQRDLRALLTGAKMYLDATNGAAFVSSIGAAYGDLAFVYNLNPSQVNGVGCTFYTDSDLTTEATSSDTAKLVACSARYARTATYDLTQNKTTFTDWRHLFVLTPDGSKPQLNYTSKALKTVWTCAGGGSSQPTNCTPRVNTPLQVDADKKSLQFNGHVEATLTSNQLSGVTVTGALPASFQLTRNDKGFYDANSVSIDSTTDKSAWNLSAQIQAADTQGPTKLAFSGTVQKYKGESEISRIELNRGTFIDTAKKEGVLDISATRFLADNHAKLTGVLAMDTPVTDSSGTQVNPTHVKFTGTLSNSDPATGVRLNFLEGELDLTLKNYDKVNATVPDSLTNSADLEVKFTGTVTVPEQPRLEVVLTTAGKAYNFEDNVRQVNLSFNRWSGNVKTRAVSMVIDRTMASATAKAGKTATLSEASSGLSITYKDGDKKVAVNANDKNVGELDVDKALMTFTDGSVVSLDLGW